MVNDKLERGPVREPDVHSVPSAKRPLPRRLSEKNPSLEDVLLPVSSNIRVVWRKDVKHLKMKSQPRILSQLESAHEVFTTADHSGRRAATVATAPAKTIGRMPQRGECFTAVKGSHILHFPESRHAPNLQFSPELDLRS